MARWKKNFSKHFQTKQSKAKYSKAKRSGAEHSRAEKSEQASKYLIPYLKVLREMVFHLDIILCETNQNTLLLL